MEGEYVLVDKKEVDTAERSTLSGSPEKGEESSHTDTQAALKQAHDYLIRGAVALYQLVQVALCNLWGSIWAGEIRNSVLRCVDSLNQGLLWCYKKIEASAELAASRSFPHAEKLQDQLLPNRELESSQEPQPELQPPSVLSSVKHGMYHALQLVLREVLLFSFFVPAFVDVLFRSKSIAEHDKKKES